MKLSRFLISIVLVSYFSFNSVAQIAIGEWRDHLPYSKALKITEANNKIYCSTHISLFFYNKEDNSIQKLSKISGLSDLGISSIKYSSEKDVLLIAYTNTNIDLIEDNAIYNISDIKRKPIFGIKTINDVMFVGSFAYLSCGFGIVVLNLDKKEIKDTYYIGENGSQIQVFEMATDENFLYAATEAGIYKADINNPNLINFEYWTRITGISNFDKKFNAITYFGNKIFVNFSDEQSTTDTIYVYDGTSWDYFDTTLNCTNFSLVNSYDHLIISSNSQVNIFNKEGENVRQILSYGFDIPKARYAIFDRNNILWIADNKLGLIKNEYGSNFESIFPNGPFDNDVSAMAIEREKLYAVGGGRNDAWNNIWNLGIMFSFIDERWMGYIDHSIRDFVEIVINPSNTEQAYAGSWGYGLHEFMNGEFAKRYDESNSTLETIIPGENYCRIGGLAFDAENNLWITNSGVPDPISVKKTDGTWKNFTYGSMINASTIGDIIITKYGHKWVILPRGEGLFAFNNNSTIDDTNDDQVRKFSVLDENGETINNNIFSIAEDLSGNIWLGTNQGVAVYYSPENVFTGENFYAQRVKIPSEIEGQANYLLQTETVTAIAIDGADRKWFGTESAGVFLLSKDGTGEILNFNVNNSPLLSNNITSIAIDHHSGEVFFGTDKGIISYKSTAIAGSDQFQKVYVYPNPVRENYNGVITIRGIVKDANVKITDISGNIVYETTALGGQAIWDGKNFSGKKVHTGVYLVFITNDDGTKTFVTKLLFIN